MLRFSILILVVVSLQTYLSRRSHQLLGLLLPLVNLIYAVVVVLRLDEADKMDMLAAFVLSNVSTVMLLVVYFTIKKTMYVKKDMKKS